MSRSHGIIQYRSPLARFLARDDVREKMRDNQRTMSKPTLGRIVFNNLPVCGDHIQSLFDIHKELAESHQPLIDRLTKDGKDISSPDIITSFNTPEINAWINIAWAKAMVDLFDTKGNLRAEIKKVLQEFKFEDQLDNEEIKDKLFIGYLQHIGAYVAGQSAPFYDLVVSQTFHKKADPHNKETETIPKKSIKEIRENISASLFQVLDDDEIESKTLKRQINTALLSIFVDNLYEIIEAYHTAYRNLRQQIKDKKNKADDDDVRKPVLVEVKTIYDEIDWADLEETTQKIKLLTTVLDATAQDHIDKKYYSGLIREVSEHAWGKRLAGAMCGVKIAALITTIAVLAICTGGAAIPFVIFGLSVLTIGTLIGGGYLLFEGFKNKPIADTMKVVRDKGKEEVDGLTSSPSPA